MDGKTPDLRRPGPHVEQASGSSYTQILYGPLGTKLALMNGQTLQKAFVSLIGGAQAVYNASGLYSYRHADWLGSNRLAVSPSRTVLWDAAYAPFGETYNGAPGNDPSFTGQNQDTATGLYDFLFRELSPMQGRWLVPDPAGLAAVDISNPQTWNRYAYVINNPLVFTDALGLKLGVCPDGTRRIACPWTSYTDAGAMGTWGGWGFAEYGVREGSIATGNFIGFMLGNINGGLGPSQQLVKFLISCEGHKDNYGLYNDSRSNCTIGIGQLVHLGPCTTADYGNYPNGMDQSTAEDNFTQNVNAAGEDISANMPSVPVSQNQFDAMVSLDFNMGLTRLQTHDVWNSWTTGNFAQVPTDITTLNAGGPGMKYRRGNEAQIFQSGAYANNCYSHP